MWCSSALILVCWAVSTSCSDTHTENPYMHSKWVFSFHWTTTRALVNTQQKHQTCQEYNSNIPKYKNKDGTLQLKLQDIDKEVVTRIACCGAHTSGRKPPWYYIPKLAAIRFGCCRWPCISSLITHIAVFTGSSWWPDRKKSAPFTIPPNVIGHNKCQSISSALPTWLSSRKTSKYLGANNSPPSILWGL